MRRCRLGGRGGRGEGAEAGEIVKMKRGQRIRSRRMEGQGLVECRS